MAAEETGGKRTRDQVRDKGQRLIGIIQSTQRDTVETVCSHLVQTNQLISWRVQSHSFCSEGCSFLAAHDPGNLAGMATFKKSPRNLSVYPDFGTIRDANPPVR